MDITVPDLAVVIATLDEEAAVGTLLSALAAQDGIRLEVIVADGGSRDHTLDRVEAFRRVAPYPLRLLRTSRGRGHQMNLGARASTAPELLFLHADSGVEGARLLAQAHQHMERERSSRGSHRVAGHFGLRFRRADGARSLAYYYFEAKTRLSRAGCVNGDQAFWLSRRYFEQLGRFDESLPFLEDARLAAQVFATGSWTALPGRISTSARRFETEGFRERQTLNALIRAFDAIGLPGFLSQSAGVYRIQVAGERLDLLRFFRAAHRQLVSRRPDEALRHWLAAGAYVRSQAWQLAFWFDCARNLRRGFPPGDGPTPCLASFDRLFDRLTDHPPGRALAATLTLGWFYSALVVLWARGPRGSRLTGLPARK